DEAEEPQDELDGVLPPTLELVERVVTAELLSRKDAEVAPRVRQGRDDRYEPQRGMEMRLIEGVPAQDAGNEEVPPEAVEAQPPEEETQNHRADREEKPRELRLVLRIEDREDEKPARKIGRAHV